MVLAGWFYIIRRHITVETPLDKRNLERRDRIFVRTTRVKNHPNRQPRRGLFFFFSSLFLLRLEHEDPPFNPRFASLPCFRRMASETSRRENRSRGKKKKKRRRERKEGSFVTKVDISIRYRGPTGIGETDFKSEKMGSNATKAFTRLALPTTGSFKANCPQRGCKLPLSADVYAHALSSNPGLLRAC